MKQFLVFSFDNYYPCGGWDDLRGSFDSAQEAFEFAERLHNSKDFDTENVQVVDLNLGKQIHRGDT